jgi:hypothetical protein
VRSIIFVFLSILTIPSLCNRRYGHIAVKRIFVFNYSFDIPLALKPLKSDPDSLIIFPPEGPCEGGSMIVVHFKEVMFHTAVKLIALFERIMEILEESRIRNVLPTSEVTLTTVYDDRDDIGNPSYSAQGNSTVGALTGMPSSSTLTSSALSSSSSLKKQFKKRPSGRIHKWMADLSMQVCSLLDAIDHYITAIVDSRAINDPLWLASALDGYATVIMMLKDRKSINLEEIIGKDLKSLTFPSSSSSALSSSNAMVTSSSVDAGDDTGDNDGKLAEMDRVYALIEERANEAIAVYSTSVVLRILEVEATLRLARMFEKASYFYGKELKIIEYIMKAISIQGLNDQQQLETALEGAIICYRLGLKRKYCLFLYIAALMTAEIGNYEKADLLLMETKLRLEGDQKSLSLIKSNNLVSTVSEEEEFFFAWNTVKSLVYTNGIIVSQEAGDTL